MIYWMSLLSLCTLTYSLWFTLLFFSFLLCPSPSRASPILSPSLFPPSSLSQSFPSLFSLSVPLLFSLPYTHLSKWLASSKIHKISTTIFEFMTTTEDYSHVSKLGWCVYLRSSNQLDVPMKQCRSFRNEDIWPSLCFTATAEWLFLQPANDNGPYTFFSKTDPQAVCLISTAKPPPDRAITSFLTPMVSDWTIFIKVKFFSKMISR